MINQNFSNQIHIYGVLTLIAVLIGFYVVFLILFKAIKTKEKILYIFMFSALFMLSPWFPTAFGYIYWVLTGKTYSITLQLLLGLFFVPFAILSWLEVYRRIQNEKIGMILIISYLILSIIIDGFLLYYLFLVDNPPFIEMVAEITIVNNYLIHINYFGFFSLFAIISILLAWATGNHLALHSITRGSSKEVQLKGKFILLGFNIFLIGVIIEAFWISTLVVIISRVFLMLTMIFLYFGFILPKWLKSLILNEE